MQRLAAAFLASVLLSPLAACASPPATADPPGTRVELDEEGRIVYLGPLTAEANARAREIFEATGRGPGTIFVSSGDSMVLWHGSAWQESFDDLADPDHPDFAPGILETRRREVSLEDLQRMGVSNVVLLDGEWEWRKHRPEYASRVRRVSLGPHYEHTPSRFRDRLPPPR